MFSESSASFLSGAFAGLVTDVALHPIDTIKTNLQASLNSFTSSSTPSSSAKPPTPPPKSFRHMFRGLTPALCGSCPSGAAFFGTYQFLSRKLKLEHESNSVHMMIGKSLIASSCAEASACLVRAPVDIVKNNMQVGTSMKDALKLLQLSKFISVYVALLYRELPFAMVQLPLLELLRQNEIVRCVAYHLSSEYWNIIEDKRVAATVVSGFFAGGTAAFLTTPSDVYKVQVALVKNKDNKLPYSSFLDFVKRSVKEQGVRKGLFRGGLHRVTMISCGGSIFFGSQEWAKKKFMNL